MANKKIINFKENPLENIIDDLNDEFERDNIKQLIVIVETNDGMTMSAAHTETVYGELGLLELAKLDALYRHDDGE